MDAWLIILIVIAGTGLLAIGGPWLFNKIFGNKDITPYQEWAFMIARFLVEQFDFMEKQLVLKVMNYVEEALQIIDDAGEYTTVEERANFAVDKALELCAAEGIDVAQYPGLEQLIKTGIHFFISFITTKGESKEIPMVDFTQFNI